MSTRPLTPRIVDFINSTLLAPESARVGADTLLFEQGVLDSLRVLDLIAFVEAELGRPLPDAAIRLANFRTPAAIAATAEDCHTAVRARRDTIWSRTRGRRTVAGRAPITPLEEELGRWATEIGARDAAPDELIATEILARAGYLRSFPGRAVAGPHTHDGRARSIPPAACLHCYAQLADSTLDATPVTLQLQSRCARGDEQIDPDHGRLRDFTMREIVIVGTAGEVDRARRALMRRAQTYVTRLDLAASIDVANDPFHVPADRGKLALQRLRALKYELRLPVAGQTIAVASFNYHEDHFGRAFGIALPDGSPAHTACVAFGLERWELALREQRSARALEVARSA